MRDAENPEGMKSWLDQYPFLRPTPIDGQTIASDPRLLASSSSPHFEFGLGLDFPSCSHEVILEITQFGNLRVQLFSNHFAIIYSSGLLKASQYCARSIGK